MDPSSQVSLCSASSNGTVPLQTLYLWLAKIALLYNSKFYVYLYQAEGTITTCFLDLVEMSHSQDQSGKAGVLSKLKAELNDDAQRLNLLVQEMYDYCLNTGK